jgi:hypothetical protein
MRYLTQYLNHYNFGRRFFDKKADVTVDNMTLDEANALAENMSAAWSPENLTCDGELSHAQVQRKAREIRNAAYELITLFPNLTIPQWSEDLFEVPAQQKTTFRVGQKVAITHDRLGGRATGTIVKVNRVKCRVEFPVKGTFNVPFSMMEIV